MNSGVLSYYFTDSYTFWTKSYFFDFPYFISYTRFFIKLVVNYRNIFTSCVTNLSLALKFNKGNPCPNINDKGSKVCSPKC